MAKIDYSNTGLEYTSEETNNVSVWPCMYGWTLDAVKNNFENYDADAQRLILKWLTDPVYVQEGLNLKVY